MKRVLSLLGILIVILSAGIFLFLKNKKAPQIPENCDLKTGSDQNICQFLNFYSPYTSEDIQSKLLSVSGSINITKLGLESFSRIEGIPLDYFQKDDYTIILVGFDSADNHRFVTPIKIPNYIINDPDNNIYFYIQNSSQQNTYSDRTEIKLKDSSDITNYLDKLKNQVIVLMMNDQEADIPKSDSISLSRIISEINSSLIANQSLLSQVYTNGIANKYTSVDYKLPTLKSSSADSIPIENMPILLSIITYNQNDDSF